MYKKILIIGCGLIGSSILRIAIKKKLSKKIFVFEKNKKYRNHIKKINKKIILIKKLDKNIQEMTTHFFIWDAQTLLINPVIKAANDEEKIIEVPT